MARSLPEDFPDFTPAWLSDALGGRHPGVEVATVDELGRSSATNLHLRLGLTFVEQAGAPESVFVKLPPLDPGHRESIGASGMGARESRFYVDVAPSLKLRVPTAHFADVADDGGFVLLLEDLAARGCSISDGSWGVPGALAATALEELAELHVRFEDDAHREAVAPWAAENEQGGTDFTTRTLRHVIDENRDILSPDYIAVGELYIERSAELERLWRDGPQTLVHGDAHIGNLFIDDGRVGFLDWGLTTVGTPMRDVSYFLTMGVDTDDRRRMQADLLRHYLDARRALGGSEIDFDEAWMAHRVHAAYTVIASFLGLMPPYNSEEGRPFATAFRERSMAALDDLETVAALGEVMV